MEQCEVCKKPITHGVWWYAVRTFGKGLCFECQKKFRELKYEPEIAKFVNENI